MQSLFVIPKICNFVVILKLTYQETVYPYHFITIEQKCCLSKSTILNKKLRLGFVANKQSLLCEAKLKYLLKIKTIFIVDEKLKVSQYINYNLSIH